MYRANDISLRNDIGAKVIENLYSTTLDRTNIMKTVLTTGCNLNQKGESIWRKCEKTTYRNNA